MDDSSAGRAPHVFRLSPEDNVAVTSATIRAGQTVPFEGRTLAVVDDVPTGHKLAVAPIAAGEKVIKHGGPIGSATRDIQPGQYVHTHNLKSDYLPNKGVGSLCRATDSASGQVARPTKTPDPFIPEDTR